MKINPIFLPSFANISGPWSLFACVHMFIVIIVMKRQMCHIFCVVAFVNIAFVSLLPYIWYIPVSDMRLNETELWRQRSEMLSDSRYAAPSCFSKGLHQWVWPRRKIGIKKENPEGDSTKWQLIVAPWDHGCLLSFFWFPDFLQWLYDFHLKVKKISIRRNIRGSHGVICLGSWRMSRRLLWVNNERGRAELQELLVQSFFFLTQT